MAKEINDSQYGALCHAIGHAGATVHVETHALGLPFYELTSMALKYGKNNYEKPISKKIDYYCDRLLYGKENTDKHEPAWADFLSDDNRPNKERLLSSKKVKTTRIIGINLILIQFYSFNIEVKNHKSYNVWISYSKS